MLFRFLFRRLSLDTQAKYLKKKGIMLGTRMKDGRKIYIYMLSDLFVEVIFLQDNSDNTPELITMLRGLDHLNEYLEREFKEASF